MIENLKQFTGVRGDLIMNAKAFLVYLYTRMINYKERFSNQSVKYLQKMLPNCLQTIVVR